MGGLSIYDMHVHLDFMSNAPDVARDAAALGMGMFAVTVTPAGYDRASRALIAEPNVRMGVGMHPWWVADGRLGPQDIERAAERARSTRYVGEIGIDLSPRHVPAGSRELQRAALERICISCAQTSESSCPKVLSIHSVRAADLVLDVLESTGCLSTCSCIFHWFSGTSDELHRAVRAGCFFSVNEMMLGTRRGREYARQLPREKLLAETDLPPHEGKPYEAVLVVETLERTLAQLATIRGTDMRTALCENALRLMS